MRWALKFAIIQSRKSQRVHARAAHMRETKFSSIVRGWTNPTARERKAIARALGQPEAELFDGGAIDMRTGEVTDGLEKNLGRRA